MVWKRRHRQERGIALLASAVSIIMLFGMAGLAIDLGRMYITKNEANGYADGAAIAAARRLDGSSAGLTSADSAVTASTNKWNFGTTAFTGTVVEYSADGLTGWGSSGSVAPANIRYTRVTASVSNLPLFFLPVVGTGLTANVKASAVAGQQPATTVNSGVFPYSPIAHVPGSTADAVFAADPTHNFGFIMGQQYDLKWPSNPQVGTVGGNKVPCAGDNTAGWIHRQDGSGSEYGEIMLQSASALASVIDGLSGVNITLGQSVNPTNGDKNSIVKAINDRIASDGDTTSITYASYIGNSAHNGRRLITVVVNSGYADTAGVALPASQQTIAVGYAQFLLLTDYTQPGGGNNPWCAVYVGPNPLNGTDHTGGGGNNGQGVGFIRLTQ